MIIKWQVNTNSLITRPTHYYFSGAKKKQLRERNFVCILSARKTEFLLECCSIPKNNATLQMRGRLIKTKHSIFGQRNSNRGHPPLSLLHLFYILVCLYSPFLILFIFFLCLHLYFFVCVFVSFLAQLF